MADETETTKPVVRGRVDGNIFSVMGAATGVLNRAGQREQAIAMRERVINTEDYNRALAVIMEYVDFDFGDFT